MPSLFLQEDGYVFYDDFTSAAEQAIVAVLLRGKGYRRLNSSMHGQPSLRAYRSEIKPRELVCEDAATLRLPVPTDFITPPSFSTRQLYTKPLIMGIGVEIEGVFARGGLPPNVRIVRDGSVQALTFTGNDLPLDAYSTGEVHVTMANAPGDDAYASVYPAHVNASAGLHVHLSFDTPASYNLFVCKEFYSWFLAGLAEWRHQQERAGAYRYASFWSRIRGNNHYCAVGYNPDTVEKQIAARSRCNERYNAINYCHSLHGTLEVRVLNAYQTAQEAAKAVREVARLFTLWGSYQTLPLQLSPVPGTPVMPAERFTLPHVAKLHVPGQDNAVWVCSPRVVVSVSPSVNCLPCLGTSLHSYPCGCVEWCPSCQEEHYLKQNVKHAHLHTACPAKKPTLSGWLLENNTSIPVHVTRSHIVGLGGYCNLCHNQPHDPALCFARLANGSYFVRLL